MQPLAAEDPRGVGPYRLLGRLGSGGMGRVFLGRSAGGRTVAVKIVHPHLAADPDFRARFAREVDAARLTGGRWTAAVLDAGPEAEVPWVATGYVAGPDLHRVVREHGPLPEPTVRALGAGLAEALAAVHARGLVHRDVKPSNVLLALDGPRLIDFGIVRAADAGVSLTATGVSVGSPGFMAPEQIRGGAVGGAADVFSAGAVLALAAGGKPPFPGDGAAQLLYRVVHEPPDLGRVPAGLRATVARCLDKDPAARPAPRELGRELAGEGGAAALFAAGWLPPVVVEDIGRRAVRLLDAEGGPAPDPAPGPPGVFGPPHPAYGAAPRAAPAAPEPGAGPDTSAPGPATAPAAPRARKARRARRVAGAVGVLAALAVAGHLAGLPGALLPDADGAPQDGPGASTAPPDTPPPDVLPPEYAGQWTGDLDIGLGIPAGPLTVTLEPGEAGEVVGTSVSSDLLGLSTCLTPLTLRSVGEQQLVFDAEVDAARSTAAACVSGPFRIMLDPQPDGTLLYSNTHPDGGSTAVLAPRP